MGQFRKLRVGNSDFESVAKFLLELERGNEGDQIGVATPLAEAIERTLNLPSTRADGSERIRHRLFSIIVCVNADAVSGNMPHQFGDDAFHLVG